MSSPAVRRQIIDGATSFCPKVVLEKPNPGTFIEWNGRLWRVIDQKHLERVPDEQIGEIRRQFYSGSKGKERF